MRIIAFVGSPVEDNEKDVSMLNTQSMIQIFQKKICIILFSFLFLNVCASKLFFFSSACEVGKTLEKRKSQCGYYQLWRRGEILLLFNFCMLKKQEFKMAIPLFCFGVFSRR